MTKSRTTKIDMERAEKLYDTIFHSPSGANKVIQNYWNLKLTIPFPLSHQKLNEIIPQKKCKVSSLDIQLIFLKTLLAHIRESTVNI